CPPIIAPCFYGVDMSTYAELFVPKYMEGASREQWNITHDMEARMAADLGADSLRYLPTDSVARAIGIAPEHLCMACITGQYPTLWGKRLAQEAFDRYQGESNPPHGE
ncbi:MAG: hypothetical protein LBI05_08005, partial [Planctomycetaceae bacterium]|nr:hypothetical protein [Planctomycetaceae bacterium]